MRERSETTHTNATSELTLTFTLPASAGNGRRIVAAYAANPQSDSDIWIVTTTTALGNPEVWPALVTKAVTL